MPRTKGAKNIRDWSAVDALLRAGKVPREVSADTGVSEESCRKRRLRLGLGPVHPNKVPSIQVPEWEADAVLELRLSRLRLRAELEDFRALVEAYANPQPEARPLPPHEAAWVRDGWALEAA